MKKTSLFFCAWLLFCTPIWAASNCFLAQEGQTILKKEGGGCTTRYAPESTFKIALSLMGYDSGILRDEAHPLWPFKKGYDLFINVWKGSHNPRTWIRDSCVWYSQVLTQKLGMKQFKKYIALFDYGNQDLSGDKGQNNGLTHAWLSSSLTISPEEQIQFLEKIVNHNLPVNSKSYEMTKKIFYIQELPGGWKLYGKTGTGRQLNADKSKKLDLQHGWFIGWIEKNDRVVTFVNHISDDKQEEVFASFRAKNDALNKLFYLINELEQ